MYYVDKFLRSKNLSRFIFNKSSLRGKIIRGRSPCSELANGGVRPLIILTKQSRNNDCFSNPIPSLPAGRQVCEPVRLRCGRVEFWFFSKNQNSSQRSNPILVSARREAVQTKRKPRQSRTGFSSDKVINLKKNHLTKSNH